MKLARLQIENFRHLGTREKPVELDFTDALGRVRDFTLLVGPNTSGKTTILDAIAAALAPSIGLPALRPDFRFSPRTVVRRGALNAKVTCWLRFSPEEIAATRDVFRLAERTEKVPDVPEVKLIWTYPDPRKPSGFVISGPVGATAMVHSNIYLPYTIAGQFAPTPSPLPPGFKSRRRLVSVSVSQRSGGRCFKAVFRLPSCWRRAGRIGAGSTALAACSRSTRSAPDSAKPFRVRSGTLFTGPFRRRWKTRSCGQRIHVPF